MLLKQPSFSQNEQWTQFELQWEEIRRKLIKKIWLPLLKLRRKHVLLVCRNISLESFREFHTHYHRSFAKVSTQKNLRYRYIAKTDRKKSIQPCNCRTNENSEWSRACVTLWRHSKCSSGGILSSRGFLGRLKRITRTIRWKGQHFRSGSSRIMAIWHI